MQPIIRNQGLQDYQTVWQAMVQFTQARKPDTVDELWVVEHPPVYTFGVNAKTEHLLRETTIPVVKSDRGGQITYHAPGQLIVYTLLDIERLQWDVRQLVTLLEQVMIESLSYYGLKATAKSEAPGVYIDTKKIGSVGLRIKKGKSYHGLSLNNTLDLAPFDAINTCGFKNLEVTKLQNLGVTIHTNELAIPVLHALLTAITS
ncbi:MAG: lipoyl(octanoyl) transferase LipB [Methylococcales bacterium]|nr:lipoyl(octanoyl) transferase LipB [Methylococcales bacterium]